MVDQNDKNMDLNKIQEKITQEMIWKKTTSPVDLTEQDKSDIEKGFTNVKNFRELWEKITSPINWILKQSFELIEKDSIMNVSKELSNINGQVQSIYNEIVDNDGPIMKFLKQIPWIDKVANYIDSKIDELKFNIKSTNAKLESIFDWFDTAYDSINNSINLQNNFLSWLNENLWKIIAYNDYLKERLDIFKNKNTTKTNEQNIFIDNLKVFILNMDVLISNLELAKKRIIIKLDSSVKLAIAMNSSRPIFKVLLSSALIEMSAQKAIDASTKSIEVMWTTIDTMSKKLTDKAIESNQKVEDLTNRSLLDVHIFVENVEKLKNHFDTIEERRKEISVKNDTEKQLLLEAGNNLKQIKSFSNNLFTEN